MSVVETQKAAGCSLLKTWGRVQHDISLPLFDDVAVSKNAEAEKRPSMLSLCLLLKLAMVASACFS